MIENDAEMGCFQVPSTYRVPVFRDDKIDVVTVDGEHRYWSTHCRHDRHADCAATTLAPGVARYAAQCKTCAAPCICPCHE